jgi:hypothetical protein
MDGSRVGPSMAGNPDAKRWDDPSMYPSPPRRGSGRRSLSMHLDGTPAGCTAAEDGDDLSRARAATRIRPDDVRRRVGSLR